MDALEQICVQAVFPNGTSQPSVSNTIVNIGQGWPPANAVNDAMPKGRSLVSIYAVPSTTSKQPVPLFGSADGVIIAPVHAMTVTQTDTSFTIIGDPNVGEYATVLMNGTAYTYAAEPGDTAEFVMASLAEQIPGAAYAFGVVSTPGAYSLVIRIGASATMGDVVDRQRQNFMISVWSPHPSDRNAIGAPIKLAIANNLTITMPDTSEAILITQTENLIDKYQDELAWRRDLTVQAEWDTVAQYPAFEITSVTPSVVNQGRAVSATE